MVKNCSHEVLAGKTGYCFLCRQAVIVTASTPEQSDKNGIRTRSKRWLHWLLVRPWPIWSLIGIAAIVAFYGEWNIIAVGINKMAGAALQVLGASLVLISIDGNIGIFKGKNILSVVKNWAVDYPKSPRNFVMEASTGCYSTSTANASLTVRHSTIDARVDELERVTVELRSLISTRHGELRELIASVRAEAKTANDQTTHSIRDLENKVITSVVGGLQTQAFGVGLALIGSVLSMFS